MPQIRSLILTAARQQPALKSLRQYTALVQGGSKPKIYPDAGGLRPLRAVAEHRKSFSPKFVVLTLRRVAEGTPGGEVDDKSRGSVTSKHEDRGLLIFRICLFGIHRGRVPILTA